MKTILLVLLLSLGVSSCIVYKAEVQQGNLVTGEMLAQVEPGMSRREVKSRLGTPLVADPFHADRWDYYYFVKQGRLEKRSQSLVTLYFDGDILQRIEKKTPLPAATPETGEGRHGEPEEGPSLDAPRMEREEHLLEKERDAS